MFPIIKYENVIQKFNLTGGLWYTLLFSACIYVTAIIHSIRQTRVQHLEKFNMLTDS